MSATAPNLIAAARKVDEHLTFAVSAAGIIGRPGALRTPQDIFHDARALRGAIAAEEKLRELRLKAAELVRSFEGGGDIVFAEGFQCDAADALRAWADAELEGG